MAAPRTGRIVEASPPAIIRNAPGARAHAPRLRSASVAPPVATFERGYRPLQPRPRPTTLVLLATGYLVAGKLGLMLGLVNASASPVWAPTGIALAAVLLLGYRVWPSIFVGAFLVNLTTAGTVLTSLGIAGGNTLEALLGAALVNQFAGGRNAFERPGDTFRFALLAGLLSTALSAFLGVTNLALAGLARWDDYRSIWLTWWLGDMAGAVIIAPVLVLWFGQPGVQWSRASKLEIGTLLVALLAVGVLVFRAPLLALGLDSHPLKFLCMPLLAWAAIRFDQRITAVAILELAAIAVWALLSAGATADRLQLNESLVLVQVFTSVAAVTTLALAAVVSERRRIDAAVRATSHELREAMTELEAFSHSLTHDLRSPVGAVLNYSEVLAHDHGSQLGDEGLRLVRRIRASAEGAARLLDQLTQYAWAGREGSERRNLDMTSLAREVYAEIVVGGEDVSGIQFELKPLPPGRGSRELVRCVFRNLLSNAVKYTRDQWPRRIQVAGVAGTAENTYSVTDNGMGFDPAHGDVLFEPFHRLPAAHDFEGTGLGLAIVARIVRRQHGRVWAESDGAHGARFSFTLPSGGASA